MKPTVTDRVLGHYPISISTSLAFEGLYGTGEFEGKLDTGVVNEYDIILINLRTLFRNAHGSYESGRDYFDHELLYESVLQDMQNIVSVVGENSRQTVKFYLCSYKNLNREFPQAKFRDATTALQIVYNELERSVYSALMKEYDILEFDVYPSASEKTILLTNFPLDLVNANKKFPKVILLESHTGALKGSMLWYTKVNGKNKNIPFNRASLIIFGDNVMFSPQDLKVRNVIKKVAEKYNWNQLTTTQRMLANLKLANEPHVADFLRRNS